MGKYRDDKEAGLRLRELASWLPLDSGVEFTQPTVHILGHHCAIAVDINYLATTSTS